MAEHGLQSPDSRGSFWTNFAWWFLAAAVLLGLAYYFIITEPELNEAFQFISDGISLSLLITSASFVPAILIGLLVASGCKSKYAFLRNLAFFYLAIIGGIPTVIMIFIIAFLAVPFFSDRLVVDQESVPQIIRGVIALSLVYSAVYGDVFRLGPAGAASDQTDRFYKRLGSKTMIASGITLIAMLKDSSLLMIIAVPEVAQLARLHGVSTFRFHEAYLSAVFIYLVLTVPIRLLTQLLEQRTAKDEV